MPEYEQIIYQMTKEEETHNKSKQKEIIKMVGISE